MPPGATISVCARCALAEAASNSQSEGEPLFLDDLTIGQADLSQIEAPGQMIGRYKLLEKVGEGGCGIVYVAEQQEPIHQRVAIKVIKLGMDTRAVVARFEAERQALAMMDHPNIAKVLDAGSTEAGRPYFVMELVRGIRITDYCDQAKLSTQDRLGLFIRVCQAIQHAHQKGIVHRDIKPSNILVTLHDGVPVPKVIDFGIAKATEGRLTDKTIYTHLHQFVGTPAYMSPEQAEISGLDIDTRSDIYSLGVLLYELLTGQPPFDPEDLLAAGLDAMRRTIREKEPIRPSTQLAHLANEELTTAAQRRSIDPPRLVHQVEGDLDWIVMKCLEKDRTRRYETANGLAQDLQRHLENEPVIARPPSAGYRFQKMVRRNKGAAMATAAIVVTLVAAVAFSTAAFLKERNARLKAARAEWAREQARQATVAETVRADTVSKFAVDLFGAALPTLGQQGHSEAIWQLLAVAGRLAASMSNAPLAEATMRLAIGDGYDNDLSKNLPAAKAQYLLAEKRARDAGLAGEHKANLARVRGLHCLMWEFVNGRALSELLEFGRACLKEQPADTEAAAEALSDVAFFLSYFGSPGQAEALAREALEAAPDDATHRFSRINALDILAGEATKRGLFAEATDYGKKFLAMATQLESKTLDVERDERRFSALLTFLGQYRPPKALLEETLAGLTRSNTSLAATLRGNLGIATVCSGDWKEGMELLRGTATNRECLLYLWFEATCLAALLGEKELHQTFCAYGLARFAAGADPDSCRVLAGGLLAEGLDKSTLPIIEELVARTVEGPPWARNGARVQRALLDYRTGHHEQALGVLQDFLRDNRDDKRTMFREMYAFGEFLKSAIEMKLGHDATALESYHVGSGLHFPASRLPGTPYPDMPSGGCFASARATELMRREAARLLGDAVSDNP